MPPEPTRRSVLDGYKKQVPSKNQLSAVIHVSQSCTSTNSQIAIHTRRHPQNTKTGLTPDKITISDLGVG
ncbi:hypothetical protein [Sporolactobacillus laevolacticus]|uniref:hypothetical protein n=1 Tax=Sporolactobacillus laevolacticus TaxID=33018 RepID=UPI0025B4D9E3|nr:hypothetical protein [Sporolactobacillus laevolacticus]MDN3956447.1 hypothetical protein [Sporolactobacillus laevolacticus]